MDGLMIYNSDKKLGLIDRVQEAINAYCRQYAKAPQAAQIPLEMAEGHDLKAIGLMTGVTVRAARYVLRNTVWIGEESTEPGEVHA